MGGKPNVTGITPAASDAAEVGAAVSGTVMFSDIEGSTELVERLGDGAWLDVLRMHNAIVREQVEAHRGFEVKSMGDGFMVVFWDPELAVRCAVAVQRRLAEQGRRDPARGVRVRIGLHCGELLHEAQDYFGRAVVVASRIAALARGGEILVSDALRERVSQVAEVEFGVSRSVTLKGLVGRHPVHEVRWSPDAPARLATLGLEGREAEREVLDSAVRRAAGGAGSALLVTGPAGLGKSALLESFATSGLPRDAAVLTVRATPLERAHGFGVVRQLFGPVLRGMSDRASQRLLAWAEAAAPILSTGADWQEVPGAAEEVAPYPILVGLTEAVRVLSEEALVVLVVDDAQWADAPSAAWLHFLARRLDDLPALLLAGVREEDLAPGPMADLVADPVAARLELQPLGAEATGRIVRRHMPAATGRFAAACHAATGGNPFFLRELIAACVTQGIPPDDAGARRVPEISPSAVSRMVQGRLERMGMAARRLADACAILEGDADLRVAGAVAGLAPGAAVEAADSLCRAGILRARRPLEFQHPILRSIVAAEIPFGTRSQLHRAAAEALHAAGAGAQAAALHLVAAEPAGDPAVVERLREAAAAAASSGTPAVAIPFLERALREPPAPEVRDAVVLDLARLELRAGHYGAAQSHARAALAAGGDLDAALRADLVLVLARAVHAEASSSTVAREVLGTIDDAVAALPASERRRRFLLEAQAAFIRGLIHAMHSTRPDEEERERLRRLAEEADPGGSLGERDIAGLWAGSAATAGEPRSTWLPLVRKVLDDGAIMRELAEGGSGDPAVELLLFADEPAEAQRHLEAAEAHARRVGSLATREYLQTQLAACALLAGGLRAAADHLSAAAEHADPRAPRGGYTATIRRGTAGALALLEGDLDAAEAHAGRIAHPRLRHHLTGLVAAARGDHDRAVAELVPAQAILDERGQWRTSHPLRAVRPDLALSLAALGRRGEAEAVARAELAVAERSEIPTSIALALRALAAVAAGDDRRALLERAAELVRGHPARLVEAVVLHTLAIVLQGEDGSGAGARGRDLGRQAAAIAAACGAAWGPAVALPG